MEAWSEILIYATKNHAFFERPWVQTLVFLAKDTEFTY